MVPNLKQLLAGFVALLVIGGTMQAARASEFAPDGRNQQLEMQKFNQCRAAAYLIYESEQVLHGATPDQAVEAAKQMFLDCYGIKVNA